MFDYCDYHYYDDDGGVASEILEDIVTPYLQDSINYLHKGNLLDAVRVLLAIYEQLLLDTPEINDDEYYIFYEEFDVYLVDAILNSINKFCQELSTIVISDNVTQQLIDVVIKRHQIEKAYNFAHWERFFKTIIDNQTKANYLLNIIEENNLYNLSMATIALHIAQLLGDNESFLKIANEFYLHDSSIALELLKRYKELNDEEAFAIVSQNLLKKEHTKEYLELIVNSINKENHTSLYIKALQQYIHYHGSLPHYKILKTYLGKEERLAFIEQFKSEYEPKLYIKMLEVEKEYPTVLEFVQNHKDYYDIKEILKPIVTIYPNEVFDIILYRGQQTIALKGRERYAYLAKLLKIMKDVPSQKERLEMYIQQLYHRQPRLPALKDEFEKAGLV